MRKLDANQIIVIALSASMEIARRACISYAAALRVSADDYWLPLRLWVKHLLHRNEEGIQINMENTTSHETVYKLAHRADKSNFSS